MNSLKTALIIVLAAATCGAVYVAWRQHGELLELRAAAMDRGERADLQKRVWDLEKRNRELQGRTAGSREGAGDVAADGDRGPRERGGRGERGGPGGRGESMQRQFAAMQELLNKPEVQAMINQHQRAAIDARYAALFKNLNLSPEQIEKVKSLLVERSSTIQDVMLASREQGLNPRENLDALRQLVDNAQNDINQSLKSVIGDEGFAQLANYEQTMPQRNLVNELQQRLSYTSTPLTAAQAEQLVQILAANSSPRPTTTTTTTGTTTATAYVDGARGPGPGGFVSRGGDLGGLLGAIGGPGAGVMLGAMDAGRGPATPSANVTTAAVTQSQTILSPPQVAALQQIQQQQQTQHQLRQMVNETLSAGQPRPDAAKSVPTPARKGG